MWLEVSKRLMGNCISFSPAFPATKFYIREMAAGIAKAPKGGEVNLPPVLIGKEIVFWRFLDSWDKATRWRSKRHESIAFTSDASSSWWTAVTRVPSGTISVGYHWGEDLRDEHIVVREM